METTNSINAKQTAEILSRLLNKPYTELNGTYNIPLASDTPQQITILETRDTIKIVNFIPNINKDYAEYLETVVSSPKIKITTEKQGPTIIIQRDTPPELLETALKKIYTIFTFDYPREAKSLFGGFQIRFLGKTYSIVETKDNAKGIFGDNYITLPTPDGWYESYLGPDNTKIPILAWKHGDTILTYTLQNDGTLRVEDIGKLKDQLSQILEETNAPIRIQKPEELFTKISEIEETIDIMLNTLEGTALPFPTPTLPQNQSEVKQKLQQAKNIIRKIKQTITLARYLEQKTITRKSIELARKILMGQLGVLSTATRKLSRLGAGYAIYINKEEAKIAKIKDKVTLKIVVEEDEKPKIIIQ